MPPTDPRIVAVTDPAKVADVVSVLKEAFFDYPVMRFVLGRDADYTTRLDRLITFFVKARLLKAETILGIPDSGGLSAVALVSRSEGPPAPPELADEREQTWAALGPDTRSRYEAFGAATEPFTVAGYHLHLNMIGVRDAARGQGLARHLLEAVHRMSAADAASTGVTLSTETPANVPLYEHFGYKVIGSAEVESAFTTWVMHRPDPPIKPRDRESGS